MSDENEVQASDCNCFNDNGSIMCDRFMPFEVLLELFTFVDHKTLLSCQLVCKNWYDIIKSYAWRRKAEILLRRKLRIDMPWKDCYCICDKQPFGKNLIKNHSGENNFEHWIKAANGGDRWKVESLPEGVPDLPDDSVFENKKHCFVTSYAPCRKYQEINLKQEGFSDYVLDVMKPVIQVSEWYSCRWDCPAVYMCDVRFTMKNGSTTSKDFVRELNEHDGTMDQWFKFTTEFRDYEPGLRKIIFSHTGVDRKFWAGHYGSKMAGACVKLVLPQLDSNIKDKDAEDVLMDDGFVE